MPIAITEKGASSPRSSGRTIALASQITITDRNSAPSVGMVKPGSSHAAKARLRAVTMKLTTARRMSACRPGRQRRMMPISVR
jgi:hypothetical protein